MFIVVRYGDNQQQIFNPDCRNTILLRYIKSRCRCDPREIVDLSDERGVVKNLWRFPQDYAKEYLKNREILVLLRVQKSDTVTAASSETNRAAQGERVVFTPLLTSLTGNAEFMETLNPSKEEDSLSEVSSKSSRRRSSTFDMEDLKTNSGRAKSKTSLQSAGRKPAAKRGHRPPLRKTTTAS